MKKSQPASNPQRNEQHDKDIMNESGDIGAETLEEFTGTDKAQARSNSYNNSKLASMNQ